MEQTDLITTITENLPAFFCVAETESGRILMLNRAAADLFGDIGTIAEAGEGNTLMVSAGDKIDGRFEYNSAIKGRWYWISHFPVTWTQGEKAEVFIGVDYGKLKNFSGLPEEEAFAEALKGPISALDRLEKQIIGYKNGIYDGFTVCYLDVDGTKLVNDSMGEFESGSYINKVKSVVKESIRKSDVFIHIGGDDFLLIFPKCTYAIVENIMATVIKKLDVMNIDNDLDNNYSISFGIMEINSIPLADADVIMSTIRKRKKDMKDQSAQRYFYNPPDKYTTSPAI